MRARRAPNRRTRESTPSGRRGKWWAWADSNSRPHPYQHQHPGYRTHSASPLITRLPPESAVFIPACAPTRTRSQRTGLELPGGTPSTHPRTPWTPPERWTVYAAIVAQRGEAEPQDWTSRVVLSPAPGCSNLHYRSISDSGSFDSTFARVMYSESRSTSQKNHVSGAALPLTPSTYCAANSLPLYEYSNSTLYSWE